MEWIVEPMAPPMSRGPMFRPGELTVGVDADDLMVDNGALVFRTEGVIVRAFGPGAWASVYQGQGQGQGQGRPVEPV